jgi:hypothetical protein
MAKEFEPKSVVPNQEILVSEAANIYRQLVAQKPGYQLGELAKQAFALAQPFAEEAQRILAGGRLRLRDKRSGIPTVVVWMWDEVKQEPLFDVNTGCPVTQEMQGDPDSHAPKLNPSHPINQRYWWLSLKAQTKEIPERYKAALREYTEKVLNS